jgi:hypothetical protein
MVEELLGSREPFHFFLLWQVPGSAPSGGSYQHNSYRKEAENQRHQRRAPMPGKLEKESSPRPAQAIGDIAHYATNQDPQKSSEPLGRRAALVAA